MSGTSPRPRPVPLLILGLGNLLCGDDGLGVAAVRRLQEEYDFPEGVLLLDGGTLGLSLLPFLEDAERVILLDAIRDDGPAGTFVRLTGDDVGPAVAHRLSVHQVGVADLLDAARLRDRMPPELILLGLVPQSLELSIELSPALKARLDVLVGHAAREARRLGYGPTPRKPATGSADATNPHPRAFSCSGSRL